MAFEVSKMDVWVGEIEDKPGSLADVLEALAGAGACLESVLARRAADKPGTGVVFVTPVTGRKEQDAAKSVGLHRSESLAALRVEGADQPGLGAQIARAISNAGINLRGLQAAVIGKKFVCYLAFDSAADANKASRALKAAGTPKKVSPRPVAPKTR